MNNQDDPILEIIACSVEDAIAAECGGANRLEIISHYEAGGLTPSFDLVRKITTKVKIPARVMLRESEAFVVADESEIGRLSDAFSPEAEARPGRRKWTDLSSGSARLVLKLECCWAAGPMLKPLKFFASQPRSVRSISVGQCEKEGGLTARCEQNRSGNWLN
jgi:hypothetical protein